MDAKTCGKCGARWLNGQHYWATGKRGSEADLAGLVCDKLGGPECINPAKGMKHDGDTWADRLSHLERHEDLSDR